MVASQSFPHCSAPLLRYGYGRQDVTTKICRRADLLVANCEASVLCGSAGCRVMFRYLFGVGFGTLNILSLGILAGPCGKPRNYSGVAPERCLKISTAILSACRCLSNDDISNSIRAIAAINPSSTTGGSTGGSLLGLAGNSSGAAAGTA